MWINRKKYEAKLAKEKEQNDNIKELEKQLTDLKKENKKVLFQSNNPSKYKVGDTFDHYIITDITVEDIMYSKTTAYGLAFLMAIASYSYFFPRRHHGSIPLKLRKDMKKHLNKGFFYKYTIFDNKNKENLKVEESFFKGMKKKNKK